MKKPLNDPGQHWHKDNIDDDYYDYVEIPGIDYPNYDEHSDDKTPYENVEWKRIDRNYNSSSSDWNNDDIPF